MKQKPDWLHWTIFVVLVVIPTVLVGYSSWELFPTALFICGLMLAGYFVSATIMHHLGHEQDAFLRQFSLIATIVLGVTGWLNVAVHAGLARNLSAASISRNERNEDADKDVERQLKLAAAYKEAAEAERRRLVQLEPGKRRSNLPSLSLPATAADKAAVKMKAPDQVREEAMPRITILGSLDVGLAFLALCVVLIRRNWDGDGNGVADWKEKMSADELKQRFPHDYAKLYGQDDPKAQPRNQRIN